MRLNLRKYWLFTYKLLPTFFIGMAVYNVIARYRKVEDVSVKVKQQHVKFFCDVTNILHLASSDFSNQVRKVRLLLYQYTYKSNDFTTVSNYDMKNESSSYSYKNSYTNYLEISDVDCKCFAIDGKYYLDLDGFYYGVGDDFGYGQVCFISPRVVLTDRYRIKLKSRPRSPSPVVDSPSVVFAPMFDDTYPLTDHESYLERGRRINDSINRKMLSERSVSHDTRRSD